MFEALEMTLRLANGLFTVGLFPFLYQIYRRTKKRFYLLWGVGFILYGINILVRVGVPMTNWIIPTPTLWFSFLLNMSGFIFIITGIGTLLDMGKIVFMSTLGLPLIPVIVYVLSGSKLIGWTATLSPWFLISLSLILIRRKYAASVDLFIVGWVLLFFLNVSIPLNMIKTFYTELLAIFGKLVIFLGMTNPRFSFLVDDLKRFLISGEPEVYPDETLEHFTLSYPTSGHRVQEIEWISEKVAKNSIRGIRTVLIILYDLISSSELRSLRLDENKLYLVRMLPGGQNSPQVFRESVMSMDDDLTQLDIFLSDIISYSKERRIQCNIILYTLSWLIHTHGWKRVYSFLISKISDLKASSVQLHCFYYPETHGDKAEISKFEKMADKVFTI